MTFRPRVLAATPGRELRWLGRLLIPGLFDGDHSFVIEPTGPSSCRLVQGETFRGLLVAMFRKGLDATAEGFNQMNQALKERANGSTPPVMVSSRPRVCRREEHASDQGFLMSALPLSRRMSAPRIRRRNG